MYSGFMIDDERIVGLKVGVLFFVCVFRGVERLLQASPDGEMEDIDVFVL